jgi:hypothetical protein
VPVEVFTASSSAADVADPSVPDFRLGQVIADARNRVQDKVIHTPVLNHVVEDAAVAAVEGQPTAGVGRRKREGGHCSGGDEAERSAPVDFRVRVDEAERSAPVLVQSFYYDFSKIELK